ncbi:MAG TPA: glycosyltransferase [Terriglobales bacterium]|nr:glycosyltransferase [Terriglobales bacterium]
MKITFIGLTISSSWGNGHATPYRALLRALERRGCELVFYERDVHYYHQRRDFTRSDYCRLELYPSWSEVRTQALADARSSDAVVLGSFVSEGDRIADDLLALAEPLRVFYDLDTPVTLGRLANGRAEYIRGEQLRHFDLVLSFTGGGVLDVLEREYGARMARPLYGCVDPDVYQRTAPRAHFRSDLSYMGTYAPDRQEKLDVLFLEPARRLSHKLFLLAGALYPWEWGPHWPHNVYRMEHVAPAEHPAFYSSSRLTLNITRASMATYGYCPSGRFFEAAACGTPIVSDTWQGIEQFFRDGEEVFLARTAEDVLAIFRRSDEELARVAARARERTLDEHTGDHRAAEFLGYLQEVRRNRRRAEAA